MTGVIIAGAAETDQIGRLPGHSTLHVFGRTRGAPHTYYYRRHVKTNFATTWTPWYFQRTTARASPPRQGIRA